MEKKLRKVKFNLSNINNKDLTIGDYEFDEGECLKEREGYFHRWGDEVYTDPQTLIKYQVTIALIEELNTGRVYKVDPQTVVFTQSSNADN